MGKYNNLAKCNFCIQLFPLNDFVFVVNEDDFADAMCVTCAKRVLGQQEAAAPKGHVLYLPESAQLLTIHPELAVLIVMMDEACAEIEASVVAIFNPRWFSAHWSEPLKSVELILESYAKLGVFDKVFLLICPRCESGLDTIELPHKIIWEEYCDDCDETIMVSKKNCEIRYQYVGRPHPGINP